MKRISVNKFIDMFLNKPDFIQKIKEDINKDIPNLKGKGNLFASLLINIVVKKSYQRFKKSIKLIIAQNLTMEEMIEYVSPETKNERKIEIVLKINDKIKNIQVSISIF